MRKADDIALSMRDGIEPSTHDENFSHGFDAFIAHLSPWPHYRGTRPFAEQHYQLVVFWQALKQNQRRACSGLSNTPPTARLTAKRVELGSMESRGMVSKLNDQESSSRANAYEAKRMEILHKVAIVFAQDGYHQTSVNNLAERLNVSKPVLYYYAKNKDDLLFQCGEVARNELSEAMQDTSTTKISGMGKVRRFFIKYAEVMCGDFGRCLVLVDRNALSPATAKQDSYHRRKINQAVQKMIADGQKDGSIRPCDPAMTARALFGAFNGIPVWFHQDGSLNARDVAEAYLDLFITGMGRG
jgi:AcrR family transcriptional regulator